MQTPFSDNRYVSRNGRQSPLHRQHAILSSVKRGSLFDFKASPKRMETKIIVTLLTLLGIGSYIGGILSNLENWKSDLLFGVGLAFAFLKFVRLVLKTVQSYKREEVERHILKKKSHESEE